MSEAGAVPLPEKIYSSPEAKILASLDNYMAQRAGNILARTMELDAAKPEPDAPIEEQHAYGVEAARLEGASTMLWQIKHQIEELKRS